jgi:hypothetical protein
VRRARDTIAAEFDYDIGVIVRSIWSGNVSSRPSGWFRALLE